MNRSYIKPFFASLTLNAEPCDKNYKVLLLAGACSSLSCLITFNSLFMSLMCFFIVWVAFNSISEFGSLSGCVVPWRSPLFLFNTRFFFKHFIFWRTEFRFIIPLSVPFLLKPVCFFFYFLHLSLYILLLFLIDLCNTGY